MHTVLLALLCCPSAERHRQLCMHCKAAEGHHRVIMNQMKYSMRLCLLPPRHPQPHALFLREQLTVMQELVEAVHDNMITASGERVRLMPLAALQARYAVEGTLLPSRCQGGM